jgi:hypothetical protein
MKNMLSINNDTTKSCDYCHKQSLVTLIVGFGDNEVNFCLTHLRQFVKEFNQLKNEIVKRV